MTFSIALSRALRWTRLTSVLVLSGFVLAACGGGGGSSDSGEAVLSAEQEARTLVQYGYRTGTGIYEYGYNSIPQLAILDAPVDVDLSRYAMVHDGRRYHLFAGVLGNDNALDIYTYDGSGYRYTNQRVAVRDLPADADRSNFSMVHNGTSFRLYYRSSLNPTAIYQIRANSLGVDFIYGSLGVFNVLGLTGVPADADLSRWAMHHDGADYRHLVFQRGSSTTIYQFGWDGGAYALGHNSLTTVTLTDTPATALTRTFAMLHDGRDLRLYQLGQ